MTMLPITMACGLYDRLLPLYRGDVQPKGIDLNFICMEGPAGAREMFDRMAGALEFDVSEFSLSEFTARLSAGDKALVALPVFPLKVYRHSVITINRKSGIKSPKDLEGKRVGVPVYVMSAAIWQRGHLQRDFGVDVSKIKWIEGAVNTPGPHGKPTLMPLLKVPSLEPNRSGRSLGDLLAAGEIDAICAPVLPDAMRTCPDIVRLFPNYKEVEKDLYRRTKVFPIMHLIAMRRDVYEKHPFVATSMYDALCASKDMALKRMKEVATLQYMMPWMIEAIEEIDEVFDDGDPWAYGIEPNRTTLETFIRYLVDQSVIKAPVSVEDMFVPTFGTYDRGTGKPPKIQT